MTYYHYIDFESEEMEKERERVWRGTPILGALLFRLDYDDGEKYLLVGPIPNLPRKPPEVGMYIGVCPIE